MALGAGVPLPELRGREMSEVSDISPTGRVRFWSMCCEHWREIIGLQTDTIETCRARGHVADAERVVLRRAEAEQSLVTCEEALAEAERYAEEQAKLCLCVKRTVEDGVAFAPAEPLAKGKEVGHAAAVCQEPPNDPK